MFPGHLDIDLGRSRHDVGVTNHHHDVGRTSELVYEGSEQTVADGHGAELGAGLTTGKFELFYDI